MKYSILLILILAFTAFGQTKDDLPILGTVSDLSGKSKVYLTAESTKSREMMQKVLEKDSAFEVVTDPKDADFILAYKQISYSKGANGNDDTGELEAYFYNINQHKVVAWSKTRNFYKITGKIGIPKKNEAFLTSEFLKAINPSKK